MTTITLVMAACGPGAAVDALLTPPSGPATDRPLVAGGATPEPPVGTSPEPPAGATDRSPSRPVEQATSDAGPTRSTGTRRLPESAPVRLQIPSIGVDSGLIDLGLQPDGTLEVPSGGFPAGWYTGAPTPGELGPAIIAGHVDWGGRPGVFFDLRETSAGDEITITRQDGSTARFRVTHVDQFDKDAFPTQAVYGDLDHAGLRLITCGGDFDRRARSYVDNLVVFAELVGSESISPADARVTPDRRAHDR